MKRSLMLLLTVWLVAACGRPLEGQVDTPMPSVAFRARDIHQATGAGTWYPADPDKLRKAVNIYVREARVDSVSRSLRAIIVPHAGYAYSGGVAGHAFRALQEAGCDDHTLIVIGDTHSGQGQADIAIWAAGGFETPLGTLPVDEELAQALLAANPGISFDRAAFRTEHPVENQFPFIQVVCQRAHVVPIVIRRPSLETAQSLAGALVDAVRDHSRPVTIVASTDLSHYHPYDEARQIDEIALQAILSLTPETVIGSGQRCADLGISPPPSTMCSMGAVLTAMIAARELGCSGATLLHYANSGDVPLGERNQVVGYGAVALWQGGRASSASGPHALPGTLLPALVEPPEPLLLTPSEQEELLELARRTIASYLDSETIPPFYTDDPALLQPLGAYVTYEEDGALRGCLGRLEGDRPVYLNVQYAAIASALRDPRFPPVQQDELSALHIEISLIHPVHPVESPQEIEIGRHGVLMEVGEKHGALFLPQVPGEQGWDLEDTLLNLCHKAGLADDAWQRPDARFHVFGGQWFGEGD